MLYSKWKKNRKVAFIFSHFFLLILVTLSTSKGNPLSSIPASSTTYVFPLEEETMIIKPGSYHSTVVGYPAPGIYVKISVEELEQLGPTEIGEPPIDVLFMTPEQFESYEAAFNESDGDSNNTFRPRFELEFLSVTSVEFFLGALNETRYNPSTDTFGPIVLVIENANFTVNGARAYRPITVKYVLAEDKLPWYDLPSPFNSEDPSIVDLIFLNVVNFIFSFNTMFPVITGAFGLIIGHKGIPMLSSRITKLKERQKKSSTSKNENHDSKVNNLENDT